jgi:CheY-like chemotaxis protein
LLAQAVKSPPTCVLLDLHNAGLQVDEVVRQLKERGQVFIIGYGSHVDVPTLKRAREAGCDLVLPRSKFVEDLPTALPRWFAAGA